MYTDDAGVVTYDYHTFFLIIGAVVIAVGVASFFLLDESHPEPNREGGYMTNLLYGFRPSVIAGHRRLYLVLLGYLVFSTALQVFMPYYVLYLRLPNVLSDAYVLVMAPGIVIAAVFTILYGRRVDKVGFSSAVRIPLALFMAGCILLTASPAMPVVFAGSVLMLSGYLGAVACFAAEIRNNTPLDNVGMLQGVRIFMVVLVPMLIGPWIGSAVSASGGMVGFGVAGDGFTPSSMIFLAGAAVSLICIPVLVAVRRTE
jgi:MFS family permease